MNFLKKYGEEVFSVLYRLMVRAEQHPLIKAFKEPAASKVARYLFDVFGYSIVFRRALRRLGPITAKLRNGEALTRKEASALSTIVSYSAFFATSMAVTAQKRTTEFYESIEAVRETQKKADPEPVAPRPLAAGTVARYRAMPPSQQAALDAIALKLTGQTIADYIINNPTPGASA